MYWKDLFANDGDELVDAGVQARVPSYNRKNTKNSGVEGKSFFLPAAYLSTLLGLVPITTVGHY